MLQALRNKLHGWPSIVVLGICVFAVSFFGIESYFMAQTDTFVAKVGKHEITQQQFQARLNQLRQQAGEQQADTSIYERPEMKQRVLDSMIDQQLLLKANDDLGMKVSDLAIRDTIASIPGFQVSGQFDLNTYRAALATQGKTPAMFENDVRSELAIQLLPEALIGSTIVTDADMDRFLNLRLQRRDLRFAMLPRPALTDSNVTDAQIDAFYKEHQADFMSPEQVAVKYLEVNGADLKVDTQPADDELKKRYEAEKQRFAQPEQRLVSHILINVPKNATPEQQKAALTKAEKVAAEANEGNFAKLAEQDSDDLGSKRQGGDLGWLEKGVANQAFDEALFALQKGQVSKPVLSPDEGYHILWLRDVRSGQAKPFEEVREQIAKEVAATEHDRVYNDVAGKLADKTYQNPSSLESAAQELKLPIKSTELFSRQGGEGIAANPKVAAAAFSDEVLAQGNNSSLIDLGSNHAVVIHVDKHVPTAARPLAQVRDSIRQKILDDRVAVAAKQRADDLLAKLVKGEDMKAVVASMGANVQSVNEATRIQQALPAELLEKAFLLPHPAAAKSQYAVVATRDGNYALLAVDKVQDGDLSKITPAERDRLRSDMAQAYGTLATHEYINSLKANTTIKIAKDRL
ncbi:SurA N-terminal domain-containing protein [Dyella tabacisoli]|uniref:Periplasmic chaperone PpiD n=1 Tax=Dyella tabacisoli TaxID=2282381 RepID=A0A369USL2_9GAMM|nr:SurA N-terminal domain-containing protein [Dyella tabacisoli]RDD83303.1 peptidylprolyl isomerase [Dyella tabacisoli]